MMRVSISSPEVYILADADATSTGANQEWYGKLWQRKAGCGPTVASMIAWYLSKTRKECGKLSEGINATKEGFCELMNAMWGYVTPGYRGVNATVMLHRGLSRYAADRSVSLEFKAFDVGLGITGRNNGALVDFVVRALQNDCPVAFLNLNNGQEKNLDRWHWVTLVAFEPDSGFAQIYDNGEVRLIDLALWFKTSTLGGGFVVADTGM